MLTGVTFHSILGMRGDSTLGVSHHLFETWKLTSILGIPPNYADEDLLKMFLNNVIAKGLNEENDYSYGKFSQYCQSSD